jgi:glycosyltransferase involved in cell wall biosynthesis
MHVVVDAAVARPGSTSIVLEHLLGAWSDAFADDRITVLTGPDGPPFPLPSRVEEHRLRRAPGPLGGLWLRSVGVRRAARQLGADAVLSGVPGSGLLGAPCPRGVILYDLRFELRPEQFSRRTRVARRVSWAGSLRLADRIFCISERTRDDLLARHPALAARAVAAQLGSDHALAWPRAQPGPRPYALAFGHFANKNADAVLAGWAEFCAADDRWLLRLVGMGAADRRAAEDQVRRLGIADRVELMPWLDDTAFARCFTGAGLVLFPSDFEGFGLPAAEALRLGIPTVVSTDPALAEVTGGHAVTAPTSAPSDLAASIRAALALTPEQLAAGRAHAASFTWRHTAEVVRAGLAAAALC